MILLDTQRVLWIAADHDRLPAAVREQIAYEHVEVAFSAVSIGEIATRPVSAATTSRRIRENSAVPCSPEGGRRSL